MRFSWASVVTIAAGLSACAGEPGQVQPPKGSPPQFVYVSRVDQAKGTFFCQQAVDVPCVVAVEREIEKQGKKFRVVENVTMMKREFKEFAVAAAGARVQTAGGHRVGAEELWRRLKAGTIIVLVVDGNPVDPAYLRVLQPDTLLVVPARSDPGIPQFVPQPDPTPVKV